MTNIDDTIVTLRGKVRRLQADLGINGRTEGFDAKRFADGLYEEQQAAHASRIR